MAFQVSQH